MISVAFAIVFNCDGRGIDGAKGQVGGGHDS